MQPRITLHPNTRTAYKIVVITLIAAFLFAAALHRAPQAPNDIVFSQFDGTDYEIVVMAANGDNMRVLTDNSSDDWGATWAPQQEQIIFHSNVQGNYAIYRMNPDGSAVERISPTGMTARFPVVSPDGAFVAFHALVGENWDIYVYTIDGAFVQRVTNHMAADFGASWSPDGSSIAFHTQRYGSENLMMANLTTNTLQRLTFGANSIDVWPSFSPDGSQIVFHSERDGDSDIYIMNVDGSNLRQLTNNTALDRVARFSPDGTEVTFRSERNGDSEIFAVKVSDGAVRQLTNDNLRNMHPDW